MSKILKFLNVGGENYNIGYSSNDYTTSDKSNLERLIDKNFPLRVTLTTNTTSSASNALNANSPVKATIYWTLRYEGNSSNEDASKYFGILKVGNTSINLEGEQLGKGSYEYNAFLSKTTTITLTVNDKVGSTIIYIEKPMYSGCRTLSQGAPNKLNELTQITPIATTIANMSNQNVTGLSTKYVYWIAIPDTLSITGAKDVNTGFGFPLELDSSVSIAGYKVYKSGGLAANTNWTIKISDN